MAQRAESAIGARTTCVGIDRSSCARTANSGLQLPDLTNSSTLPQPPAPETPIATGSSSSSKIEHLSRGGGEGRSVEFRPRRTRGVEGVRITLTWRFSWS